MRWGTHIDLQRITTCVELEFSRFCHGSRLDGQSYVAHEGRTTVTVGDAGRESRKDGRRPTTVDPHVSSGKFVDENRILQRLALKNRRPRRP